MTLIALTDGLPFPTKITYSETTSSSVLINIEPPTEYDTCITHYTVEVDNRDCPNLTHVNDSKYELICSNLDPIATSYHFSIGANSNWFGKVSQEHHFDKKRKL